jgi:putative ubiquitin-RnfH superfamily antitoxin RatB of RatAB toxin-antitoxin module
VSAAIHVDVAYAAPGIELVVALTLPAAATVADAVAASGLRERCGLAPEVIAYAIHGQRVDTDTQLADGDRVEITRPLQVDAKEIRRLRAAARPLKDRGSRR